MKDKSKLASPPPLSREEQRNQTTYCVYEKARRHLLTARLSCRLTVGLPLAFCAEHIEDETFNDFEEWQRQNVDQSSDYREWPAACRALRTDHGAIWLTSAQQLKDPVLSGGTRIRLVMKGEYWIDGKDGWEQGVALGGVVWFTLTGAADTNITRVDIRLNDLVSEEPSATQYFSDLRMMFEEFLTDKRSPEAQSYEGVDHALDIERVSEEVSSATGPGKPKGAFKYFAGPEHFLMVMQAIVCYLRDKGIPITQSRLVDHFNAQYNPCQTDEGHHYNPQENELTVRVFFDYMVRFRYTWEQIKALKIMTAMGRVVAEGGLRNIQGALLYLTRFWRDNYKSEAT